MRATDPRVVVVDDDPTHNLLIAGVLRKFGIEAHITANATEFLLKLKSMKFDLCLLDLNIGELRVGYSIIQAVRKVLGENLPIIVISGRSSFEAINHAMELGANDFVVKPIEIEMLAAKLSRFLETPQLSSSRHELLPVPGGGAPATVELPLRIHEVDEFGVLVSSQHMLSKGSVFRMEGPVMQELSRGDKPMLLTAISSYLGQDCHSYFSFLEFDHTNDELMANVRNWLVQWKN